MQRQFFLLETVQQIESSGAIFFPQMSEKVSLTKNYQTRDEVKNGILNYILMFYNSQRLHSKLGYVSPQQFENNYWGVMSEAA